MFSGIVANVGQVLAVEETVGGRTLRVDLAGVDTTDLREGDSVAVNGVCLTAHSLDGASAAFDVITETLRKTSLGALEAGGRVNLERSLRLGDPIDGHLVQGHVDDVGRVVEVVAGDDEWRIWIEPPPALRPLIVPRGSIAIDGVSLTVARVEAERFAVALIPTTLQRTTLGDRQVGDAVNLETDLIARQILLGLAAYLPGDAGDALRQLVAARVTDI